MNEANTMADITGEAGTFPADPNCPRVDKVAEVRRWHQVASSTGMFSSAELERVGVLLAEIDALRVKVDER